MRNFVAKIWVPALLVLMAGVQSFGLDAGRAAGLKMLSDSLMTSRLNDSSDVSIAVSDTVIPEIADSIISLTAKDTIVAPD